jgi:hypothetical protein
MTKTYDKSCSFSPWQLLLPKPVWSSNTGILVWEKETLSSFCLSGLCLLLSIFPCFGHTVFLCVHFCTAQPLDWLSYTSIAILWIFTSCHDLVSLYWTILIWFSTITTTTSKGLLEPTFCAHFYSWVLHIALCSSYLRALWFGRK